MLNVQSVRKSIRGDGQFDRRLFLSYLASLSATSLLAERLSGSVPSFTTNPFRLGVASGDPQADSVVLWTRLAPDPLVPGGGMPPENVEVRWEIADDECFNKIVRQGTAAATPALGHSVHVEPDGLDPDRWYFYRFRAGDADSPLGRTRTAPEPGAAPDKVRFAFASCQHFEAGYFTAYEHMAEEDLDLVIHLGDYIYEGRAGRGDVRRHIGDEIRSLDDYRIRYSLYRSDLHLQRMHARCPWLVTWDDHEVDNNYAGDICEEPNVDPADFLVRRANAYQAYFEMMPLRRRSRPKGPSMRLYRSLPWGQLAQFNVLDTRQFRTDQPNGDGKHPLNDAARNERNSMLGSNQFDWLQEKLTTSATTWNVLAQQVMFATIDRVTGEEQGFSMDQWSGYLAERRRLISLINEHRVANPVVLTGDIHSNWVNELRIDDERPEDKVVATEFVGTSISSGGDGERIPRDYDLILAENAPVKWHNRERGYVSCTVTDGTWQSDYQVVERVTRPGAPLITRGSYTVESGIPTPQET